MARRLLYVGAEVPRQGYGASICLYRHLSRLDGWEVSVVATEPPAAGWDDQPVPWRVVRLSSVLQRWPPAVARVPIAYRLWLELLGWSCRLALRNRTPDAILNVFGLNSFLAYALARLWRVPLSLIVYDRWEVWVKSRIERRLMPRGWAPRILDQAARVWTVSEELGDFYPLQDRSKVRLLRPIPEGGNGGFVAWREEFRERPTVAFAGFFHDHHLEPFRRVATLLAPANGTLLVISDRAARIRERLSDLSNVEYREPFARNADLLTFLRARAAAMLIPWSFAARLPMPYWAKTSFPSKLVEFSHLGLPLLIIAPPGIVISNWASSRRWRAYLEAPEDEALARALAELRNEASWKVMAAQSRQAALGEFDPGRIQAQFERELAVAPHSAAESHQATQERTGSSREV